MNIEFRPVRKWLFFKRVSIAIYSIQYGDVREFAQWVTENDIYFKGITNPYVWPPYYATVTEEQALLIKLRWS